jgi:hypothetical protein
MPVIFPESLSRCTLWRYMSLHKLLSILQTNALYFSCLADFEDEFEGAVPAAWRGTFAVGKRLVVATGAAGPAAGNRHGSPARTPNVDPMKHFAASAT